jgi:hypothetical protein
MPIRDYFQRRMTPDRFADLLMSRLKKAGERRPIAYDRERFSLKCEETDRESFAEFGREDKQGRERVVRVFLSAWFTTSMELPRELDMARADLLVAVRDRSYFEIDVPLHTSDTSVSKRVIYQEVAGCLAAAPVYDLPTAIRSLDSEDLERWGITLYEAIEIALENLAGMTDHYAKIGDVFAFAYGDGHDASRLLLTDRIESFEVVGQPIAMVPQRELLLVADSHDDKALGQMLDVATEAIDHERRITGRAFQLVSGQWQPWLPEVDHPHYERFARLAMQSIGDDYARQQKLLERQLAREGANQFVATFNAVRDDVSGQVSSFAVWTEGVDTLLPRVDRLLLVAAGADKSMQVVAAAQWQRVVDEVGYLLHEERVYPARFRAMDFPSADELQRIGIADWARRNSA